MPEPRKVSRQSLSILADLIDVETDQLIICRDLLNEGNAYHSWETPKGAGGMRMIDSPCEELKAVQRRILTRLLYSIPVHTISHGFVRDRDIMTNARCHADARVILNVDLKNAFPSVRMHRVGANLVGPITRILDLQFGEYITAEQIHDLVWMLVRISTHKGCLPQGAPTSPALLNLVCLNLDRQLLILAMENGLRVTRYADDITISSRESEIPGELRQKVRSIVSNTGWKLNQKKTTYSRRRVGNTLEVTGLLIQDNGRVTVPTKRRERYRDFLRSLLEKDSLSDSDRATAVGIVVYVGRVYGGRLPSTLAKLWKKVKEQFGIPDAPKRKQIDINPYMPDLPRLKGDK